VECFFFSFQFVDKLLLLEGCWKMFFREMFFLEQSLTSDKDSSFSGMQLVQSRRNWLFELTERLTASLPNLLEPIAVYPVFVHSLQGGVLRQVEEVSDTTVGMWLESQERSRLGEN
jgi:hypothetical protein